MEDLPIHVIGHLYWFKYFTPLNYFELFLSP